MVLKRRAACIFKAIWRGLHTTQKCLHGERWLDHSFGSFYYSDLTIATTSHVSPKPPDWDQLVFGHHFSDHMLTVEWNLNGGWERPKITPLRTLELHPASKALHYAIQLFEGVKAYRGVDGKIRMFRPEMNMKRMLRSATRACLPTFDGDELIKCMLKLVEVDQDWVPDTTTSSLYLRPALIGTAPHIGIGASDSALLFVITGPVGSYYPTGLKPVRLLANPKYVRTFKGGTGDHKLGCNYAPTILIGKFALDEGCQQVLWLYGEDQQITEVGTMNIFILMYNTDGEKELVTPALTDGLILPGITRYCILDLVREWNEFKVSERKITMTELLTAHYENRLLEVFGTGTACVVSPVDRILYQKEGEPNQWLDIPTMNQHPCLMEKLFEAITDIQYGRVARPNYVRELMIDPEISSSDDKFSNLFSI